LTAAVMDILETIILLVAVIALISCSDSGDSKPNSQTNLDEDNVNDPDLD
jgi:hypothetical protein